MKSFFELQKEAQELGVKVEVVIEYYKLLEMKKFNELYKDANVLVSGYPSALEKIAILISER